MLTTKLSRELAQLTGNGRLHRDDLEQVLTDATEIKVDLNQLSSCLDAGRLTSRPIDYSSHDVQANLPQDGLVDVTWQEAIDRFAHWLMPTMNVIRMLGSQKHRILIG